MKIYSVLLKHPISLAAVLIILLGCTTINYIGESYPPTQHVDLYFSEEDIEKEYNVVGRIIATANSSEDVYSSDKFTKAILKKAREKGADGVVIFEFGISTRTSTVTTGDGERTSTSEKRRIEALVIRYKGK
jgi:hypothetical protein